MRGLDYYTRTAFEFYVAGREGQQQAIGAGGRYDGLVELLGGRPTPGIGFGLGLDRTVLAMQEQGVTPPAPSPLVAVIGATDDQARRLRVAATLREAGLAVRPDGSSRKLGKQLESAAKAGARWAVIIGEGEARGAEGPRQRRAARRRGAPGRDRRRQRMKPAPMVIVMLATMPIRTTMTSTPAV